MGHFYDRDSDSVLCDSCGDALWSNDGERYNDDSGTWVWTYWLSGGATCYWCGSPAD